MNDKLDKINELKARLKDYEDRKRIFSPDNGLGIDNASQYDKLIAYIKDDIKTLEA